MSPLKEPNLYEQQLVSLGRVLQSLRTGGESVEAVLTYLKENFAYDLIWVGLYDRIEHRLLGKGGKSPLSDNARFKQRFTLTSGDVLEQVVIQQRPLTLPDLRQEIRANEWRNLAQKANIQGTMIFPISYHDRCYGVTILGSKLWGNFPKTEEKALLSIVLNALAATLEHRETEQQRQQLKPFDEPLLELAGHLRSAPADISARSLSHFEQRLDAIVEQTHQWIQPTRTSIYWFERQRRYFWRRVTDQKSLSRLESNQPESKLTVQEISSFYQAMMADQIVSIPEAMSSLKTGLSDRIMQQISARSLMAAPILYQNQLLGFLTAEGSEPRLWKDQEKGFLRAAAHLVALVAPLEDMETTIEQTKLDQALIAEIARSIYSTDDWQQTLKNASDLLNKRIKIDRFIVLRYDSDRDQFDICYQSHLKNRRALSHPLKRLNPLDEKLLNTENTTWRGVVAIENLTDDLRLAAWRTPLLELGVRSLIACNTSPGQKLEGVLLVGLDTPRSWSQLEGELTQSVAHQIGLILRQWTLQQQNEQQQKIYQTLQWGITTIQQTQQLDLLEKSALQYIAQILQAPMAVLISWAPGRRIGRLVQATEHEPKFSCNPVLKVSIETDPLMQRVLAQEGILSLSIDDLSIETRQWLNAPAIGQVLVAALRTAREHEPTGILIIADHLERHWLDRHLTALEIMMSQFAWSRRYLMLSDALRAQRDRLERLSWYKHRRLEDLYRTTKTGIKRLSELSTGEGSVTRQQQILTQLDDTIEPARLVIRDEQWQLSVKQDTVPMLSVVRRALDRVDHLIKQRQLWSQVHHDTNPMIFGDIPKIELVLYEVLLIACQRAKPSGRIDIWCRQLDAAWMEIAITDEGAIEPRLIEDLEAGRAVDLLAPSTIDKPPGLHLAICQALMKQMGGEFNLYKLEDGRIMSRLVVSIG